MAERQNDFLRLIMNLQIKASTRILPFLATAVFLAVIDKVLSLNSTPVAKLQD